MELRKLRSYDKEFKLNAVKLYLSGGRSYPVLRKELGIPTSTLVSWVRVHKLEGQEAFPGKGHLSVHWKMKCCLKRLSRFLKRAVKRMAVPVFAPSLKLKG